jgi:hypothetical protein
MGRIFLILSEYYLNDLNKSLTDYFESLFVYGGKDRLCGYDYILLFG